MGKRLQGVSLWQREGRAEDRHGTKKNGVLAAVVIGILMAVALCTTGIGFETNDDKCIAEILAGVIAPTPDAHVVYVNYVLALPLSLLYRVTARIPWYGAFLIALQGIAYGSMLDSLYDRCRSRRDYFLSTLAGIGLFFINFYLTGQIQYTSTAALLAMAGYVCLVLQGYGRKGMAWFGILELLSFLLRSQAMLMVQPLGLAVCAGLLLGEKPWTGKKKLRSLALQVTVLAMVCLVGTAGNAAGYRDEAWQEYNRANEARTLMFDYYGAPAYEEVKSILDHYQVTETAYEAYLNYVMPYGEVTPGCAEEIAAYTLEHQRKIPGVVQVVKTMGRFYLLEDCWGLNHIALLLWCALSARLLWKRRLSLLWPLLGLGVSRVFVWSYLIVRGRLPLRLTLPLFACEILFLMIVFWADYGREGSVFCGERPDLEIRRGSPHGAARWFFYGIAGVLCGLGCLAGGRQICHVFRENQAQKLAMEEYRMIREYCLEQEEYCYLLDAISFCEYRGSALETDSYRQANSVVTGNWYAGSPVMEQFFTSYLEKEAEGICLIVRDDGREREHPAVRYLTEKYGAEPEKTEILQGTTGRDYLVWCWEKGSINFIFLKF